MGVYPFAIGALLFIFGACIGSFLNVVLFRYGSRSLRGRSKCLSCGKNLTPSMLIPLWSFARGRARCAYCEARLSPQYFLVELAVATLFVFVGLAQGLHLPNVGAETLLFVFLDMVVWSTLVLIFFYDLRHKIIPDLFSFLLALEGGLLLFTRWLCDPTLPLTEFLAGPLLALPFAALWFFSGGRLMGLGDAKLSWGIGWFLGLTKGISALVFSFWIALLPSLYLLLLSRKNYTMKSEVPFGPFLILGTLVVYVFRTDITAWIF